MTRKLTHQDQSNPRLAQDAARRTNGQARNRYVRRFDDAPNAYIMLDPTGRIAEINAPAAVMLGERRSHLRAPAFADFVTADSIETWRHYLDLDVSGPDKRACEL